MDGFDVVASIRRIPGLSAMPVIFITGSARADMAVRAREIAVRTVPLDEEAPRDAVKTCVHSSRAAVS